MDLSAFFEPISATTLASLSDRLPGTWGKAMARYEIQFPDWQKADIVLIGCRESRGAQGSEGMGKAAAAVRAQLYSLSLPVEEAKIVDLGDLKGKETPEGFYEALAYVSEQLIRAGKTVLIIGGSQDISYGQYLAYEAMGKEIEYVQIDPRFDMLDADIVMDNQSYNHRIFLHKPNYLFNFTNLGYQRYLNPHEQVRAINDLHFSAVRYGDLYGNIHETEPYLRTADMVSMDLSCVRHNDAPGATVAFPGGFSAMEACRIARYAGLGYGVSSFSITEFNPAEDLHHQSARLVAMMVWYFTEGFYNRTEDRPREDRANLKQYSVRLHASVEVIDFFQHPTTRRWWMEVPYQDSIGVKNPRTHIIPCSEKDYDFARADDIPERWWLTFNKLK